MDAPFMSMPPNGLELSCPAALALPGPFFCVDTLATLAAYPVTVSVEVVGVGRQDGESSV